jgi:hypothetical protein
MARSTTVTRLSDLAEDQWGLLTRQQAAHAGVPQSTFDRLATDGSILERVAHGVYHLAGAPLPDHFELRAAWLQLASDTPAWERTIDQGVVSHRSAAALYGLGHLPADTHEFTLPSRRQTRRPDIRLHRLPIDDHECIRLRGLPVTRPSRIASDLLAGHEDPEAVGSVVADAIRGTYDYPATFANSLAPHAARFGLRRDDGLALLRWLLDLVGDPNTMNWIEEARRSFRGSSQVPTPLGRTKA